MMNFSLMIITPVQAAVFDFQPCDPENIYVAIAALSRTRVPGDRP